MPGSSQSSTYLNVDINGQLPAFGPSPEASSVENGMDAGYPARRRVEVQWIRS